jgi:uncharacterized membrane protein
VGLLIIGLILFLGIHAIRIPGEGIRNQFQARFGPLGFKLIYSVVSLLGLVAMAQGYAQARLDPTILWVPPAGLAHAASLLTLFAFVLLVAAYVPGNIFLAKLKHPMTIAVKLWAFAHLLSNGGLHDVLLFGGFLLWAVLVFRSARRRQPMQNPSLLNGLPTLIAQKPRSMLASLITLVVGIGAWAWFAFQGHLLLIGVAPFGG